MNLPAKQRGMGIFGLMYILITLGIFGYIGLKMFPMYLENIKIKQAVDKVVLMPSADKKPKKELVTAIVKRLDIDGVSRIKERNWQDTITITQKKGKVTITAAYQASLPLFLNLSVVADFHHAASNR